MDEHKCKWCGRDMKKMNYESISKYECWICFQLYPQIQDNLSAVKKMIKEIEIMKNNPKEEAQRLEWLPKKLTSYCIDSDHYMKGFNEAIDAVLEAAEKHGIVFVKKENLEPRKLYNFSCECGWLHKGVTPGFRCMECGRTFDLKTSDYSVYDRR